MSDPIFNTIEWDVTDRIGHLVITQPPSNKMTVSFFRDMGLLKEQIQHSSDLKAIIITGKGRHFSSGADLDELLEEISRRNDSDTFLQANYSSLSFLEMLPIPVISAIRGVCLGSALELALFSHFRFCSEEAVLGMPEATFKLIPGIGGIQRFTALAGKAKALDYILTGQTFDAQTALELGIVDAVVAKRDLITEAEVFLQWLPENFSQVMRRVYLEKYSRKVGR
ncbi:MAG: enoyl-CoA hydratase/isomerase family protein [Bacteroidales bacterium]|nr:enoyl-CoA hydratase/isomerase family protein [Bacteroidales bacterium]